MLFYHLLKTAKSLLKIKNMQELFSCSHQKHLIQYTMSFLLPIYMHMVSLKMPWTYWLAISNRCKKNIFLYVQCWNCFTSTSWFSPWPSFIQYLPRWYLFFYLNCDTCDFADDTTRYVHDKSCNFIIQKLEEQSNNEMTWFETTTWKWFQTSVILFSEVTKLNKWELK